MCYSGKCKYENNEGDCTIPWGTASYPDDALCTQDERRTQEAEAETLGTEVPTQMQFSLEEG
jgi:hypothetical protein